MLDIENQIKFLIDTKNNYFNKIVELENKLLEKQIIINTLESKLINYKIENINKLN